MNKWFHSGLIMTGLLLSLGCEPNDSPPVNEQAVQTDEPKQYVLKAADPLPVWEPHIEASGLLSDDYAQWYVNHWAELDGFTKESPPTLAEIYRIIGINDCIWYCGCEYKSVTASSLLASQKSHAYGPGMASDLRYDTAWIEGVEGPGIGESLIYRFDNKHPRITKVLVHTGYIKNESIWVKNNRVRMLELAINGKPTALLQLSDTRAQQTFDLEQFGIGPLGRRADGEDLILRFTIRNVYPGTMYDDTAISEIYFDGIDVH